MWYIICFLSTWIVNCSISKEIPDIFLYSFACLPLSTHLKVRSYSAVVEIASNPFPLLSTAFLWSRSGRKPEHISNFILHDFYFKTFSRPRFRRPSEGTSDFPRVLLYQRVTPPRIKSARFYHTIAVVHILQCLKTCRKSLLQLTQHKFNSFI